MLEWHAALLLVQVQVLTCTSRKSACALRGRHFFYFFLPGLPVLRGERSALSRSFILLQPIRGQRLFTQTSPNMPRKCPNFPPPDPPPHHALSLFKFCHPVTVVEHEEVARAGEGEI